MTRLKDRPTGDILMLMIAGTICAGLVFTGMAATVFAFIHPDADLGGPARYIADITNTLIGLMAGFLAGSTDKLLRRRQTEEPNEGDPP
jgi:hypothetical protein